LLEKPVHMTPAFGSMAVAGAAAAFAVEYLCSRRERPLRAIGVMLGTAVSFGAAVRLASLFGNHMAPRMPGAVPILVWTAVALAPLVAVIRGKRRRQDDPSAALSR
jgi:drug/metabolite transporter (DMT)-like permease